MRNALLILSLGTASLIPNLAKASPANSTLADISQSSPVSVYAPPLSNNSFDLNADQQLLPVRGSDLPLSTATASNGTSSSAPQASVVEAIPTPTAFHAGGLLLIAMFAARYFRKLRLN